ncbi:caspase, EACC1-associated type [Streptomyces novaecaesareae]|uniref:caspase, EACC1-associated type n=1 Tax=Streptomyces novaecaesareae TaxID=68244 RepID=UPI0005246598|nr:AAA family ATPase [Streptomyces novaecaesareae]
MTDLSGAGVRVLLIGTATHPGPTLTSVPAVSRTINALRDRLISRCGVPADQVRLLADPETARDMATAIAEEAQQAQTTLLLYYLGHGLIGPGNELYLAASSTDQLTPGLAAHQALRLADLREALSACRASSVVVVLDCCFSGRAKLGNRSPQQFTLPPAHGMYLLGSAEQLALAPEDAQYTAFTGALIKLVDEGDPRGPRLLTLDAAYDYLFRTLRAQQGPLPRRQAGDRSGGLVLAVNPAQPEPVGRVEEEPFPGGCPYLGLESFAVDDAEFFHGRERLVEDLVRACGKALAGRQSVIVVGPSGAGKTSVLRAGLVAALRRGVPELPGSAGWPSVLLTPGAHPLQGLAAALHPDGIAGSESLRADPGSAAALVGGVLAEQSAERLVLVVDQLEELFTVCQSQSERTAFLAALAALAADAQALVVLALRADFYGQALDFPELAAALRDHQVQAVAMRPEELRAAIERPAELAGLTLDEGLADLLLHELGATQLTGPEPGTLPMLSHTLWAIWRQRHGARLTVAGLRATGGITQAIARTADDTYDQLDEAGRSALRRMLPRLVRVDDRSVDTAQRVDRASLVQGLPDSEAAERALYRFAEARLLVLDEQTVALSHDALLRGWLRLRAWVDADREWLRTRQRLAADAETWWEAGQDPSLLYRGTRLAAAREGAAEADRAEELPSRLTEFLDRSKRYERRRVRRGRAAIASLVVLTLLSVSGGGLALTFQQESRAQQQHAVAQLVAAEAADLRNSQPGLAKQLAVAAYRLDPQANRAALFAAVGTDGVFDGQDRAADLAQSTDGRRLAISTGNSVALWSTAGAGEGRIQLPGVGPVALSPDGRLVAAAAGQQGKPAVRLWDIGDPAHPKELAIPPAADQSGVTALAFSPDGHMLAAGTDGGTIRLLDLSEPAAPKPLPALTGHTGVVDSLTFAPSGRTLASAGADRSVHLWDLVAPARPVALPKLDGGPLADNLHPKPLHRLAFSPDGNLLVGPGDGDGNALRLWDVRNPTQPHLAKTDEYATVPDCRTHLISAAFSPDGHLLATVCEHSAMLWQVSTDPPDVVNINAMEEPLVDEATATTGPALFVPAGNPLLAKPVTGLVLTATGRGVHLTDVTNPFQPGAAASLGRSPSGFVVPVTFSSGPRQLVAWEGESDGALWDLSGDPPHHRLAALPGSGQLGAAGVAFSPDGRILATGELDQNGKPVVRLRSTEQPDAAVLSTIDGLDNSAGALAFASDGRTLAVSDTNDHLDGRVTPTVKLYDLADRTHPHRIAVLPGEVFRLAFSSDHHLLAGGGADSLQLWDTTDPRHPTVLPPKPLTAGALVSEPAFSPDGHLLAVSDSTGATRLWEVTGDRLGDADPVVVQAPGTGPGISFSPDGRTLAMTGTGDSFAAVGPRYPHIELWDVGNWRVPTLQAVVATGPTSGVRTSEIAVSADGKLLATVGATVDIWSTDQPTTLETICESVGDTITDEQWQRYVPGGTPYRKPCP